MSYQIKFKLTKSKVTLRITGYLDGGRFHLRHVDKTVRVAGYSYWLVELTLRGVLVTPNNPQEVTLNMFIIVIEA